MKRKTLRVMDIPEPDKKLSFQQRLALKSLRELIPFDFVVIEVDDNG